MWVMAYPYRQVYACKSNGRFLDTKINLMDSFKLHIFWWMYRAYAGRQFLEIVWKSSQWFLCGKCLNWHNEKLKINFMLTWWRRINSLYNVSWIKIPMLKKHMALITNRKNVCQNAALLLNAMHLNIWKQTFVYPIWTPRPIRQRVGWYL